MLTAASLDHTAIARLIPHHGSMCLLARVEGWDAIWIECHATSHRAPDNPLRHDGRLGVLAGIEYAMQATALHGALTAAAPQKAAYLAVLREVEFGARVFLDEPDIDMLRVQAWLEHSDATGFIYRFNVGETAGGSLVSGRAVISVRGAVGGGG